MAIENETKQVRYRERKKERNLTQISFGVSNDTKYLFQYIRKRSPKLFETLLSDALIYLAMSFEKKTKEPAFFDYFGENYDDIKLVIKRVKENPLNVVNRKIGSKSAVKR